MLADMGGGDEWSEAVHKNRTNAALERARIEYKIKKNGYSVPVYSDSGIGPIVAFTSTVVGMLWWRSSGKAVAANWKSLPVIGQFYSLITNSRQQALKKPAKKKLKPSSSKKTRSTTVTAEGTPDSATRKKKSKSAEAGAAGEDASKAKKKSSSGKKKKKKPSSSTEPGKALEFEA